MNQRSFLFMLGLYSDDCNSSEYSASYDHCIMNWKHTEESDSCLWRVSSSGIWHRVVRRDSTYVSEEHIASRICLFAGLCWTYFLDPEDGGDMFLRNVGWNSTDYAIFQKKTLFITIAVKTSNPRQWSSFRNFPGRKNKNHEVPQLG
jgi:hypothetical protein